MLTQIIQKEIVGLKFSTMLFSCCCFLVSCFIFPSEKNLEYNKDENSLSLCDGGQFKGIFISKDSGNVYLGTILRENLRDNSGKSKIYLGQYNEGYSQDRVFKFDEPNTYYTLTIPMGDLVLGMDIITDERGQIKTVKSESFCEQPLL